MSYCPAHDPILAAGHVRCPDCGRAGYPADAEWITADLILADYPAPCQHVDSGTLLVDVTLLGPSRAWCNATASSTGELCRKPATGGTGYCRQHRDSAGAAR